jgi:hypothetical protein
MAKKKEIKLTRTAGETVESGDVNFSYNDVLIGSLSDSGSAVLKTENTVVKHDIEVEYTKPTAEIVTIPVYTQIDDEGTLTFAKNISALAGEIISDSTIPLPANVDETRPFGVTFQPGYHTFYGDVSYNRDNMMVITCYMPNSMPGNADKLVITMYPGM